MELSLALNFQTYFGASVARAWREKYRYHFAGQK
jgi:hypothetical protein